MPSQDGTHHHSYPPSSSSNHPDDHRNSHTSDHHHSSHSTLHKVGKWMKSWVKSNESSSSGHHSHNSNSNQNHNYYYENHHHHHHQQPGIHYNPHPPYYDEHLSRHQSAQSYHSRRSSVSSIASEKSLTSPRCNFNNFNHHSPFSHSNMNVQHPNLPRIVSGEQFNEIPHFPNSNTNLNQNSNNTSNNNSNEGQSSIHSKDTTNTSSSTHNSSCQTPNFHHSHPPWHCYEEVTVGQCLDAENFSMHPLSRGTSREHSIPINLQNLREQQQYVHHNSYCNSPHMSPVPFRRGSGSHSPNRPMNIYEGQQVASYSAHGRPPLPPSQRRTHLAVI